MASLACAIAVPELVGCTAREPEELPRWPIRPGMEAAWLACADDDLARVPRSLPTPDNDLPKGSAPTIGLPDDLLGEMDPLLATAADLYASPARQMCTFPEATGPLQTLAGDGGPVVRCCDPTTSKRSEFRHGPTEHPRLGPRCSYILEANRATHMVIDRTELGHALAPIESPVEALGALAIIYPDIAVPLFHEQKRALAEQARQHLWQSYEGVAAVEIEAREWGWIMRVPEFNEHRCDHLLRQPFAVARTGHVCRLNEEPVPLAFAHNGFCPFDAPSWISQPEG
jgi:hypothetical protein